MLPPALPREQREPVRDEVLMTLRDVHGARATVAPPRLAGRATSTERVAEPQPRDGVPRIAPNEFAIAFYGTLPISAEQRGDGATVPIAAATRAAPPAHEGPEVGARRRHSRHLEEQQGRHLARRFDGEEVSRHQPPVRRSPQDDGDAGAEPEPPGLGIAPSEQLPHREHQQVRPNRVDEHAP